MAYKQYSKDFFQERKSGAKTSADILVPLVLNLLKPESIVDIGCGTGEFLEVCQSYGITDFLGIDGEYVNKENLVIPQEKFATYDLEKPLKLDRQFDLTICLEVAEHIAPEYAETLIESLVNLSPVILFSAAVPNQGGVNHVNEQWITYWAELFKKHEYVAVDAVRKKIWNNQIVKPWYRQNIVVFCKKEYLDTNSELKKAWEETNTETLSVVHPDMFSFIMGYMKK